MHPQTMKKATAWVLEDWRSMRKSDIHDVGCQEFVRTRQIVCHRMHKARNLIQITFSWTWLFSVFSYPFFRYLGHHAPMKKGFSLITHMRGKQKPSSSCFRSSLWPWSWPSCANRHVLFENTDSFMWHGFILIGNITGIPNRRMDRMKHRQTSDVCVPVSSFPVVELNINSCPNHTFFRDVHRARK